MTELKREIVEEDLGRVKELLKIAVGEDSYDRIERLGGMTNHSYHVTFENGEEYLVRIPGEGTEEMIVRNDERKSTELACELGIDSKLLYFGDDGTKVMEFIKNPKEMKESLMQEEYVLKQAAEIFHRLHTCEKDTGVRFEVFEMAKSYEDIILYNHVALYDDYDEVKNKVMAIKKDVDKEGEAKKVPCHNDSLIGNWVLDENDHLYLIDWEYSGMNEAMWDLSCTSIECEYSDENDKLFLDTYFGRQTTNEERKRFVAAKMYVDYLWTLWGLTRVPYDGQFMQDYADNRYQRLKRNIEAYEKLKEESTC